MRLHAARKRKRDFLPLKNADKSLMSSGGGKALSKSFKAAILVPRGHFCRQKHRRESARGGKAYACGESCPSESVYAASFAVDRKGDKTYNLIRIFFCLKTDCGRKKSMKKTVGIVFADKMEFKPFEEAARAFSAKEEKLHSCRCVSFSVEKDGEELTVIAAESGIGKVSAAFAASALILEKGADVILNAGLSGAISSLRRGDIVAGESFIECDFDLSAIGYDLGQKPDGEQALHTADRELLKKAVSLGIATGRFGTGDVFLTDKKKKKLFKEKFEICAFDMETAAIAAVCEKCAVPFFSVRKVSDDADDCSAEDYREMNERAEACLTDILFKILSL